MIGLVQQKDEPVLEPASATTASAGLQPVLPPLARFRFTFRMDGALRLPWFAGSLLRGVFGNALRRTACMTRAPSCDGCPLRSSCPYAVVFDPQPPASHGLQQFSAVPVPYVLEPGQPGVRTLFPGEEWAFQIHLVGRAINHLPIVLFAMQRAFKEGIGKHRAQGRVVDVAQCLAEKWHSVWDVETEQLTGWKAETAPNHCISTDHAELRFVTPLRLQENGRMLQAPEIQPRHLLMALVRRLALLQEFHAGGAMTLPFADLSEQAKSLRARHDLGWRNWTRYSSRQEQEMNLGGLMGSLHMHGHLADFAPFLEHGQYCHVGKNASFGLGQYQLFWHSTNPTAY